MEGRKIGKVGRKVGEGGCERGKAENRGVNRIQQQQRSKDN